MGLLWVALLLVAAAVDRVPGAAPSGADEATEVNGVLGGSVTFQLRTSEQFESIDWLKSEANKDLSILALLKPEGRCTLKVLLPAFKGRLSASENCRELQVSHLRRGDSGRYAAQIQPRGGGEPSRETFELRVYKRLTERDVAILCHTTGNGTRWLNCSAGPWEDGVTVRWEDASEAEHWGAFAVMEAGAAKGPNVTCRAKNPVIEASRTVSVKETCEEGAHGVQASSLLLGVTTATMVVAKVVVSAGGFAVCLRRRPGRKRGIRGSRKKPLQDRDPPTTTILENFPHRDLVLCLRVRGGTDRFF